MYVNLQKTKLLSAVVILENTCRVTVKKKKGKKGNIESVLMHRDGMKYYC